MRAVSNFNQDNDERIDVTDTAMKLIDVYRA
jgi:hypothetical protein